MLTGIGCEAGSPQMSMARWTMSSTRVVEVSFRLSSADEKAKGVDGLGSLLRS